MKIINGLLALLAVAFLIIFYDDSPEHGFDRAFWLLMAVLAYMAYDNDKKSNRLLLLEQKVEQLSNHIRK